MRPSGPVPSTLRQLDSPFTREFAHQRAGEQSLAVWSRRLKAGRRRRVRRRPTGVGRRLRYARSRCRRRPPAGARTSAIGSPTAIAPPFGDQPAQDTRSPRRRIRRRPSRFRSRRAGRQRDPCPPGDEPGLDGGLGGAGEHLGHPHDLRPSALPFRRGLLDTCDDFFGTCDRGTFEHLRDARRGLAPVTRSTGWSSQSKSRRWISSASQPP